MWQRLMQLLRSQRGDLPDFFNPRYPPMDPKELAQLLAYKPPPRNPAPLSAWLGV